MVVVADVEVDLRHPGRAAELVAGVEEHGGLDRVAGRERQPVEEVAARRHLPRERLDETGELGEEQVDQRAGDELGHAATAALAEDAALDDRPLVVALDVLQPRLVERPPYASIRARA